MKIKTVDLIGPALDWAVATALNLPQGVVFGRGCVKDTGFYLKNNHGGFEPMLLQNTHDKWVKQCETYPWGKGQVIWRPSTDWRQGGPLIEREWLDLTSWPNESDEEQRWQCHQYDAPNPYQALGPTPLIAAMRCYVASKLGDEVEVPDELVE